MSIVKFKEKLFSYLDISMKINKHTLSLIIILTVIVFFVESLTIFGLYNAAFEQQRSQLIATTQSQAKLIESVARFDERFSANDVEGGSAAATMKQIQDAHLNNHGFGKSGEFLFGKIENNNIIFLLPRRFKGADEKNGQIKFLDVGGSFAEPIQLALEGKSGAIVANDYRGEQVLAAYAPVRILNYGVVTKIDMKEIREPFIYIAIISVLVSIVLIAVGAIMFFRITNPMVKRIEGSAMRLNEAQRLAKVGSWELDLESGELIWSDEIFNIFEIDKHKFSASYDAFLNAIHPDDRDEVNQAYSDSLVERNPYEISHRLKMKGGAIKYVHETCESFYDNDKKPIRSVGTVQDITERKLSNDLLIKEKDRTQNYLDIVAVMMLALNEKGEVTLINNKGCELLGYQENEILGKNWFDNFLPENVRIEVKDVFASLMRGEIEPVKFYESLIVTNERDIKMVAWHNSILKDEEGNIIGTLSSGTDVTELNRHRNDLENLVEERTKELHDTQNELVRKERLATLGQLTATVSHELRNPLGAMRPSVYVIQKNSDQGNERMQKAIERLDRNIDRCDRIIDELLDFTRITDLHLESVFIDEWLESVISEQVIPDGIKIEKDLDLSGVKLDIDSDRLRRAIINIIENACHAMMDENKKSVLSKESYLIINTGVSDKNIEITITDTGRGMSQEILGKIFEPLFSTKGFGVGLGMPTVKQIINQHGGVIEIKSEEGKGTRITLLLPISEKVNKDV